MKKDYIKPENTMLSSELCLLTNSTSKYNDVGNFGFGDKDDNDRTGDDDWDDHWNW